MKNKIKRIIILMVIVLKWNVVVSQPIEVVSNISHSKMIKQIEFNHDGSLFATKGEDNLLKIWNTKSLKVIRTLDVGLGLFKFHPNGESILHYNSNKITWYKIVNGSQTDSLITGMPAEIIAISPDGKLIAFTSYFEGKLKMVDLTTRQLLFEIYGLNSLSSKCIQFSYDGKTLLVGAAKSIRFIDSKNGSTIKTFSTGGHELNNLFLSQDQKQLIALSEIGAFTCYIEKFDVESGALIKRIDNNLIRIGFPMDDFNRFFGTSGGGIIDVWNLQSGIKEKEFNCFVNNNDLEYEHLLSFKNLPFFLAAHNDCSITLNEIETNRTIKTVAGNNNTIKSITFSNDESMVAWANKSNAFVWSLTEGRCIYAFSYKQLRWDKTGQVLHVRFMPDNKSIVVYTSEGKLSTIDISTGKIGETISALGNPFNYMANLSSKGDIFITHGFNEGMYLFDFTNRTSSQIFKDAFYTSFSNDSKTIYLTQKNDVKKYLIDQKKEEEFNYYLSNYNCFIPSIDGKQFIGGHHSGQIVLIDSLGKSITAVNEFTKPVIQIQFVAKNRIIAQSINQISVLTYPELKVENTFKGNYSDAIVSPKGKWFAIPTNDGCVDLYSFKKNQKTAQLVSYDSTNWVITTPNGYWDGSTAVGELVSMVQGVNSWNIDQFALYNNRPDSVLAFIGMSNKKLIDHYTNQVKKRQRKIGISLKKGGEKDVPIVKFISTRSDNQNATIEFTASGLKTPISSYNVFVNDVSLYGFLGKQLPDATPKIIETVPLCKGENKIEISCKNSNGIESRREVYYTISNKELAPNLYLLSIGVSIYRNPKLNLSYAHKDAIDLEKLIQNLKGKGFENVYTKILTNEQVTPEAIKASKDFVKNAKPDDTFILFIAGHGMHDKDAEATYYYLTSNADINNLKGTAADFETIEDLLQGIPPRNKLFLMDACESGEIDEEDQGQMIAAATGAGIASRGLKKVNVTGAEVLEATEAATSSASVSAKRSYLYQKDRYIYNDLVRRSGAIVFSSSKGGELSYERSDIENGLFTEYIMKALTTNEADKDGNGTVSTDELRNYVSVEVAKASGDLQHPTVDRDNIYQKFGFGIK